MLSYNPLPTDVECGCEDQEFKSENVYDVARSKLRQGFIKKIFGILTAQLAVTAAVTIFFINSQNAVRYVANNPWTLLTSFGASFGILLALIFSETLRRHHPWNTLALSAFTIAESVLVAFTCSVYDHRIVLMAVALTGAVVVALTIFAMQTKVDFTRSYGFLTSLLMVVVVGSLMQMFLQLRWLHFLIVSVSVILFSVYLVFDIQLIVDGGKYSISPDEYVFAAINIYLDIINLFLSILQILNDFNKN
uniref:Uncharacterized protein n=2 Tax=Polytomella parva TaxID=51329 RepID=A0A7S0VKD8_9CHLO|mmetsp:Transcript_7991/g.15538  ORF Transcript_7991/g.15538 Transcript_7991/m.15538 type:complete len:249 (+) Transcript_7991:157-903(+)